MSLLAALATLALLAAAFVGVAAPARRGAVRVLAGLGAAVLLPTLESPAAWPALAAALGAAVLASPLGCGLASAGACLASLRMLGDAPADSEPTLALAFGACAAVFAMGAVEQTLVARVSRGARVAWLSVGGGMALLAALFWLGKGSLLRWSLVLTAGETRLAVPGAALVLGIALLAALLGTLAQGASLLARDVAWARVLGQRALLLATGLAVLGLGLAVVRAASRAPATLLSGAVPLAALWGAVVSLAVVLLWLLEAPIPIALRPFLPTVAAALAALAVAAGGYEAWSTVGSYQTAGTAALGAAALLGLAGVQPTRLELTRRLVFLAALLALFAQAYNPAWR